MRPAFLPMISDAARDRSCGSRSGIGELMENCMGEDENDFNEFNIILDKLLNKIVEIVFNKSYNELFNFNINKIKNNIENFNIDNNNNINDFILLTNIQFYFKNNIESEKKKIDDELIKNFNKFEEETERSLNISR